MCTMWRAGKQTPTGFGEADEPEGFGGFDEVEKSEATPRNSEPAADDDADTTLAQAPINMNREEMTENFLNTLKTSR